MASWFVIDWDQEHFHVLLAQSSRHGVKVTRAVSWPHPEPFTPSTAERVGKAFRDFLKSERLAAAPVLFGLGRDRVFLKELRFPEIAPHEEAGLVRFQTGKELTESVESYAIDYTHLKKEGGERQVMAVAVRRDIVAMIQTFCQAAGLRLHAVTPRLFGLGRALERSVAPDPSPLGPQTLNAVISVGERWADLCFFRGGRLLQAQALATGTLLKAEINRNLAVFKAQQAVNLDLTGPDCLFAFGSGVSALLAEDAGVRLPVRALNPLAPEADLAALVKNPGCFAGAVGLADLWSSRDERPVNLASPKRQTAPISLSRQRAMLLGSAAAVLFLVALGSMWYVLYQKRTEVAELGAERTRQEEFMTKFAQERAEVDAYKDWQQTTVPWLDEIYDLSARYPWEVGFRVNQFSGTSVGTKKNSKDGFIGKISLSGFAPPGKQILVNQLNETMSRDTHVKPSIKNVKNPPNGPIEYQLKIDLVKQDYKKYDTRLVVPVQPTAAVEKTPESTPMVEEPKDGDTKDDGEDGK